MATNKKKLDDQNVKILRDFASQQSNRTCFDCEQRGPTYINVTIGSFVCTSCSGILRGLNPPHRVKSISMTSFTTDEVSFVQSRGNLYCRSVWLGLYDSNRNGLQNGPSRDENKVRSFMIKKYEKKLYYSEPTDAMRSGPQKAATAAVTTTTTATTTTTTTTHKGNVNCWAENSSKTLFSSPKIDENPLKETPKSTENVFKISKINGPGHLITNNKSGNLTGKSGHLTADFLDCSSFANFEKANIYCPGNEGLKHMPFPTTKTAVPNAFTGFSTSAVASELFMSQNHNNNNNNNNNNINNNDVGNVNGRHDNKSSESYGKIDPRNPIQEMDRYAALKDLDQHFNNGNDPVPPPAAQQQNGGTFWNSLLNQNPFSGGQNSNFVEGNGVNASTGWADFSAISSSSAKTIDFSAPVSTTTTDAAVVQWPPSSTNPFTSAQQNTWGNVKSSASSVNPFL